MPAAPTTTRPAARLALTPVRGPVLAPVLVLACALALGACSKKQGLPSNTAALGLEGTQGGLADLNGANGAGVAGVNGGALGAAPAGSTQEFQASIGDRVFFGNDSAQLSAKARDVLDGQARWLRRYASYPITLEGHADERGTREYNLALGARRAAAARDYLVSQGISRTRIRTISFGKERPVAVCREASCFNQNRRAVTLLSAPGS